ncbi:hypothetical protein CAEBREN_08005 [Caenorhabditis brenneri]|uniref:DUF281 domain-containing protein n=1 Tax=Caenorhabditis brenneri TaxID=135651 RepID=G0NIB6_CAEBE|nr:hypothetical protein CAEBREN_08005 [Caenorhabditis brenneri]
MIPFLSLLFIQFSRIENLKYEICKCPCKMERRNREKIVRTEKITVELPLEDGCKRTRVTCKREGVSKCRLVDALLEPYGVETYAGTPTLGIEYGVTSMTAILSCEEDGAYYGIEEFCTNGEKVKIDGIYCHFAECE